MADVPSDPSPTAKRFTKGRLVRALAWDRQVRVLAVVADGPAREMCRRHDLKDNAAHLASEGLVATVLLSSQVKGEERMSIEVQSETPAFAFTADVWGEGRLRARFSPTFLPEASGLSFAGFLGAVRSLRGRELYKGVSEVKGERFEQALARFMTASEQVDGRVRVHVELDEEGQPDFVAGLLVERLPGLDPEAFAAMFDEPLSEDFRALMTGVAFGRLAGHEVEVLEARELVFQCTCSKQRVRSMLAALGPEEVASMLEEDGGAEVTCHYCNTRYDIADEELAAILEELASA